MSDCDCSKAAHGAVLKSLEEALALLLSHARAVEGSERLPLDYALGRVLAEPVVSRVTMPPWDNSAMDGYAVAGADLQGEHPRLPVSQRIPAGSAPTPLEPGTAARIFTGAPVPRGADTVVIQEVCEEREGMVTIQRPPATGANIRRAGEDTRVGDTVLQPGTRLGPQHLGLAASVGVAQLPVCRRLKVALFSSGDELVEPGQTLAPGQIYNSNAYTLKGLLNALGCEVIDLGTVRDSFAATCEALERASAQADLVMSSGGVSVGEEDHLKPAVEKLGTLDLWRIAIRPGKPLAFGRIGGTPFIGTPGNPVSLFVTFCLFARPFILKSQGVGEDGLLPIPVRAQADFDWAKPDKRREFARARLRLDDQGSAWVTLYRSRSSGVLSSVAWAGGLAVLPEGAVLKRGDPVEFIPFSELLR
jgi:molybdopterin molybdotransferase